MYRTGCGALKSVYAPVTNTHSLDPAYDVIRYQFNRLCVCEGGSKKLRMLTNHPKHPTLLNYTAPSLDTLCLAPTHWKILAMQHITHINIHRCNNPSCSEFSDTVIVADSLFAIRRLCVRAIKTRLRFYHVSRFYFKRKNCPSSNWLVVIHGVCLTRLYCALRAI